MAVFATPGEYTEQVLGVVESIPPGRVMTYGDVAAVFGARGARAVGMVMRYHGSGLPWWRVIRSGGHPPTGLAERALLEYEREGTPLLPATTEAGYRIDYDRAAWSP
jgi:alkylated DNA nucleotide flippase Atl1